MREIKFRGFSISAKRWIYGYVWIVPGVNLYYMLTGKVDVRDCSIEKYEVYPKSIGEYTGLKDKSSKEIYEGDIIQGLNTWAFEVLIKQGHSKIKWKDYSKQIIEEDLFQAYINSDELEAIGNIYENPELLEE